MDNAREVTQASLNRDEYNKIQTEITMLRDEVSRLIDVVVWIKKASASPVHETQGRESSIVVSHASTQVEIPNGQGNNHVRDEITSNEPPHLQSAKGSYTDPDLVHLEIRNEEGFAEYITCKVQNCSEGNRTRPFPGRMDENSLVIQDDYTFVQVTSGGRPNYYVSYKREAFAPMKLPKYSLPKNMQVISTDENQVFAAVQEWNQEDTYNLYISDIRGIYFTLALENVKSSRGPEGNVMVDLYEVAGIKGLFLANKKVDSQVKTFITYNKGRDWHLLQAPDIDLRGQNTNCFLPYCSLHLHLQTSENPYTAGNIASKSSAPGIILASGNIGSELQDSNKSMFISSDAGNTWREIFEEEHSILYMNQGGALVAIKHTSLPMRQLWISFDEGMSWHKYIFTSLPLIVDGILGEPGGETLIMTVFGHFSYRSEWQLVKVDYRSIFKKKCVEGDYQTWQLHNQGELCIMGEKRSYKRRKTETRCMVGKEFVGAMRSEPCACTAYDFECDYGYERHSNNHCLPAFWFNPNSMTRECSLGQSFLNITGYRRVVSNNCTGGVRDQYTAKIQPCPTRAPKGFHIVTSDGKLTADLGHNVTFLIQLDEGDIQKTKIYIDFGDGTGVSFSNISSTEEGIIHSYKTVGIMRVMAYVENNLGSDTSALYFHITCPLEHVHLSLPFVATLNKEINATVIIKPRHVGTVTYVWWFGNNTEPITTLEGSLSFSLTIEGTKTITVQVSAGNSVLQDKKSIAVYEHFLSHPLSFSPNLDIHNPDIPEWRLDIGKVVKNALVEATGIDSDQLLVALRPGLPTAAELFVLPSTEGKRWPSRSTYSLEQISEIAVNALNHNLVQFTLKPGVTVLVHLAYLTAAPLVDSSPAHNGSAMLMLLCIAFVGLAVFVIYKFKRKIPGINVYAQMQNEKEQEMVSPVSQSESMSTVTHTDVMSPDGLLQQELDTRFIGDPLTVLENQNIKEIPLSTTA
ncbi:VPS10 domain-containing receptor SorCS1-like [Protopterus annectens]|uniref:VPS10 domain-containing receptor SorCS1-like n=1 Tax=Protopterus annectens TaxID=7888 RepID=UPI001CFA96D1|nr:VPS10 domain-containing receptor SorCS1-like [Protopterus annectens]